MTVYLIVADNCLSRPKPSSKNGSVLECVIPPSSEFKEGLKWSPGLPLDTACMGTAPTHRERVSLDSGTTRETRPSPVSFKLKHRPDALDLGRMQINKRDLVTCLS